MISNLILFLIIINLVSIGVAHADNISTENFTSINDFKLKLKKDVSVFHENKFDYSFYINGSRLIVMGETENAPETDILKLGFRIDLKSKNIMSLDLFGEKDKLFDKNEGERKKINDFLSSPDFNIKKYAYLQIYGFYRELKPKSSPSLQNIEPSPRTQKCEDGFSKDLDSTFYLFRASKIFLKNEAVDSSCLEISNDYEYTHYIEPYIYLFDNFSIIIDPDSPYILVSEADMKKEIVCIDIRFDGNKSESSIRYVGGLLKNFSSILNTNGDINFKRNKFSSIENCEVTTFKLPFESMFYFHKAQNRD